MLARSKAGVAVSTLALAGIALWIAAREPLRGPQRTAPRAAQPATPAAEIDRLVVRGDYVAAFLRAVAETRARLGARGPLDRETLALFERVGRIAHLSGALEIAEEVLDFTLARRRELLGPRHPDVAESLLHRGLVARYAEDRELAWDYYEQARAIEVTADVVEAEANWLRSEDLDAAIGSFEQALELRLADPHAEPSEVAETMTWLGWSMFHRGKHEEARPVLERAGELLREAGLSDQKSMGVILSAQADELAIRGMWSQAAEVYARSTAIFESVRRKTLPGFARRQSPRHGYAAYALARLIGGDEAEAWRLLQQGRGAVNADFLLLGSWPELDPPGFAEVTRRRRAWAEAEREHARLLRSATGDPGAEARSLLRKLERRAAVLELEWAFLDTHAAPEATLEALRARLGPHEAYVGWEPVVLGNQHGVSDGPLRYEIWAYVVRRDGVRFLPLVRTTDAAEARAIEDARMTYLGILRRAAGWPLRVERDEDLRALGAGLGRTLVEPILPALAGVETLVIELSDLVPTLPVGSIALSDGTCLAERYSIAYAPSASSYLALSDRARSAPRSGDRPVLLLGQPAFRGVAADPPPLPHSGREVAAVASRFPRATVLEGASATEGALRALADAGRLADYGVVHVATHMSSHRLHERSGFALAPDASGEDDGFLDLREILGGWRLDADLVTLSGCQSVSGSTFAERGEYLGFTQAMFAAGARSVLASMWPVDDEATALLMDRFYENLTGSHAEARATPPGVPMSAALALREASLWLRDHTDAHGRRPFEHPVYWSGFILIGPP